MQAIKFTIDGPMGEDYTVVLDTINKTLTVDIIVHNSEARKPDVVVYTVDPDGWLISALQDDLEPLFSKTLPLF